MAKDDTGKAGTPEGHNSKARAAIIRSAIRAIAALEKKRQTVTDEIAEIKLDRIKGDLGMKIADFNAAYRLYKLEGDDRDQYLDTLKETFEALKMGDQLDFVDALKSDITA